MHYTHKDIKRGNILAVREWLEKEDTNINRCRGGKVLPTYSSFDNGTALHWAAYYGQLEIAELLLERGAGMQTVTQY